MKNQNSIKTLEIGLAILLNFVPLILFWTDGSWRSSISDYAYSRFSYIFCLLLTLAGSTFLFNGFFFKRHWYNIILGASLFGIVLTPHNEFGTLHYVFASVFFVGSVLAIQLSSNQNFRLSKNLFSGVISLALLAHFVLGWYSLLVAEWIAILPISVHFISKSINYE